MTGLILLCLISCGSKSEQDSVQFHIDPNLLSSEYRVDSLGFSFSAPAGWQTDSVKAIHTSLQQFQNEELKSYTIKIQQIFYDSSSASFCSVSLIQSKDSLDLNYFVSSFNTILSAQLTENNLNQARFSRDGLEISQFLIMSETKVYFKLFFKPTNTYIIQLDYAIDRNIYPNYIKKIESSIGSITTI